MLAERVIAEYKDREELVVTGGMTTSGPAHLGTICEFLFPWVIAQQLKRKGRQVKFYFIADIFDAFDSIPAEMKEWEGELKAHLGKPLCNVPDPTGESESFGDHYLDEAKRIMDKLGVRPEIVRINEYYEQGRFDEWARLFLRKEKEVKEILERVSGRKLKNWSPLMAVCAHCGKIATTRVVWHDGERFRYVCDVDVGYTKGCGEEGESSISEHKWKLVWRLHWPAWKQIFSTCIEGAGVDHHTRGGSEDSCKQITEQIIGKKHPLSYKYGFVLLRGKKFSKSKGIGLSVRELIKIMPPQTIKYMLLRPDLEENLNVDLTPPRLLRAIEEYERASRLPEKPELIRAEEKMLEAYNLSGEREWGVAFADALVYYQLYKNWEEVKERTGEESVMSIAGYVEEWVKKGIVPEEYAFSYRPSKAEGLVAEFLNRLKAGDDALTIHNAVFDFAREKGVEPKKLFAEIYKTLLGKERGPRLGKLLVAIGVERVKRDCLRS